MFGVLVVEAPDGTVGYLRAFSGMLDGRWRDRRSGPTAALKGMGQVTDGFNARR